MKVEIKLSKEKFTEVVQNILHNMAYVDAEITQNLTIELGENEEFQIVLTVKK